MNSNNRWNTKGNLTTRCAFVFCILGLSLSTTLQADDPLPFKLGQADNPTLVIHADDAGMCRSVNRGTIDALENGVVSSVSIMVPCPAFEEFAQYAKKHPEYDYGIHLTLNAEFGSYRWGTVADAKKVPSLLDETGNMWKSVELVAQHAVPSEVEIELRAQIDRALDRGIKLTHIDSHMGSLWMRPDLTEIYVNLGIEYNLSVLFFSENGGFDFIASHPEVKRRAPAIAKNLRARGMPIIDHGLVHYVKDSYKEKKAFYRNALKNLKPGITGLYVHCGYHDDELSAITGSVVVRDGDRRVFTDYDVIADIKKLGLDVVSWGELRRRIKTGEQ